MLYIICLLFTQAVANINTNGRPNFSTKSLSITIIEMSHQQRMDQLLLTCRCQLSVLISLYVTFDYVT